MTKPSHPKNKDVEAAGRLLSFIYETGFLSRKRMMVLSFTRGFFSGLGGFIGATLGVALIIWILSIFVDVPIVGPLFESLENTIK